jgi:hypothetical protein
MLHTHVSFVAHILGQLVAEVPSELSPTQTQEIRKIIIYIIHG